MQIVIPLAGEGRRFAVAGYDKPKPLLPIDGVPMIIRAIKALPHASRLVLIVQSKHLRDFGLAHVIRDFYPTATLVETPSVTRGQAESVQLALPFLSEADPVTVAACDNIHVYNTRLLQESINNNDASCFVWTYRNDPRVKNNPFELGWVKTKNDGREIDFISCKKPISSDLLEDHVVSGCFTFRSARILDLAITGILNPQNLVNNEFYLDLAPNVLSSLGHISCIFEVERYIGWGTPTEYQAFINHSPDIRGSVLNR